MSTLLPSLLGLIVMARVVPDAPIAPDEAVLIALANSPRLKAARMEAEATQAEADREKPIARPTVTARAEGTIQGPRVLFPRDGAGEATVLPEQYGQAGLTVDQLIFRPGGRAARERYAAQSRAARWGLKRAENDLILDVRQAYVALKTAEAMADVARGGAEMALRQVELSRLMLQAGTAAERDVKAAEADAAQADQGVYAAESGVVLARGNLNRLMGRNPSGQIATRPLPPLPAVPDSPAAGIELALKRRPEILLLEENLRAAQAGAELAATQDKPGVSARAVAQAQTPTAFQRSDYFGASLVLTWNPFDGGKTRADVKEARARAAQVQALLDDARLGVGLDVEKAWSDAQRALKSIEAADRQVAAAQAAADVPSLRYQARSATQIEVSASLFNVVKARGNRTQAVGDLFAAMADYAHATGAGVEAPARP